MSKVTALVLAAGKGTRMKSKLPKVLHKIGGKAMVEQVLETVDSIGIERKIVIVGFGGDAVKDYLGNRAEYVTQHEQNGTGHAVKIAKHLFKDEDETVLILCGDTPLIKAETLEALIAQHQQNDAAATILTTCMPNPFGYGRIIRDENGYITKIVEEKDSTADQKKINEVNTGIYAVKNKFLWNALDKINSNNAQGELYLTDIIGIFVAEGKKVGGYITDDHEETLGINSRTQLAQGEKILRLRINQYLMDQGVTIIDPENTYIEKEVVIGEDTIIYPGSVLEGNTVIGRNCQIGPHTRMQNVKVGDNNYIHFTYAHDCEISSNVDIGPYVHLRPNTVIKDGVHIGNFVEVKNSNVGEKTKLPHLSYIGDSDIGSGVNIGCGTITVNYNGRDKNRTTIEDNAFVGCNSNLVAPVTIGSESYIGAGSTITKDVPAKALAVGRSRQVLKDNWVKEDTFKKRK